MTVGVPQTLHDVLEPYWLTATLLERLGTAAADHDSLGSLK